MSESQDSPDLPLEPAPLNLDVRGGFHIFRRRTLRAGEPFRVAPFVLPHSRQEIAFLTSLTIAGSSTDRNESGAMGGGVEGRGVHGERQPLHHLHGFLREYAGGS